MAVFTGTPGSPEVLREMIEWHVSRAIDEQKGNASGIAQYVRHIFAGGVWRGVRTFDADQPVDGFTISAVQTTGEVAMLRAAWEAADDTMRSMIRRMAELSISSGEAVPTRRHTP